MAELVVSSKRLADRSVVVAKDVSALYGVLQSWQMVEATANGNPADKFRAMLDKSGRFQNILILERHIH